jgi:hypothetical protein
MQGAQNMLRVETYVEGGKVVNYLGQLVAQALFSTENAKYLFKTKT